MTGKGDFYLVVGMAVVIILIGFVLHWFGFWQPRTFREFWQQ